MASSASPQIIDKPKAPAPSSWGAAHVILLFIPKGCRILGGAQSTTAVYPSDFCHYSRPIKLIETI